MNTHTILTQVLHDIHPKRIPAPQKEALNKLRQEVAQVIQQEFPLRIARLGEPRTIGSAEKGTDTALDFDLDLIIPFRFGYYPNAKDLKNAIFQTLSKKFALHPSTTVRPQRVSVGVIRSLNPSTKIRIDVVPGIEKEANAYDDLSQDIKKKYLTLYDQESNTDRTTNVHLQIKLVLDNMLHYRDTLRLLKAWRHKDGLHIGSYALELLVYRAATAKGAPETGSPEALLKHTLAHLIPFLEADGALQDNGANYDWPDYVKRDTKTQIAGRWRKLLAALEKPDPQALRSFFP